MSTLARRVTRVTTDHRGSSSGSLQFWEHGSEVVHRGNSARFDNGRFQFEADYGVSPGVRLAVHLMDCPDLSPSMGADLLVERLDALPRGRFRIAGRWRPRR